MNRAEGLPPALTIDQPRRTAVAALPMFFIAAYLLTWLCWLPIGLAERDSIGLPFPSTILLILGGMGPMVAAILVSAYEGGSQSVRSLFGQLKRWRVGSRWYVVAIPGLLLLDLAPIPVHVALGGSVPTGEVLVQILVLPFIFVFTAIAGGGLDEEMGWRGYALPRLQQRLRPIPANLLLGIVWSCWHLPLWFIPGSSHAESSFLVYLVSTTAFSFILGWIYNGTGGSLLLAVFAHAASNVSDGLRYVAVGTPDENPHALALQITLAIVTVIAAVAIIVATRGTLARDTGGPVTSATTAGDRS